MSNKMWVIMDDDGYPVFVTDNDTTKEMLLMDYPQYYAEEVTFI